MPQGYFIAKAKAGDLLSHSHWRHKSAEFLSPWFEMVRDGWDDRRPAVLFIGIHTCPPTLRDGAHRVAACASFAPDAPVPVVVVTDPDVLPACIELSKSGQWPPS